MNQERDRTYNKVYVLVGELSTRLQTYMLADRTCISLGEQEEEIEGILSSLEGKISSSHYNEFSSWYQAIKKSK